MVETLLNAISDEEYEMLDYYRIVYASADPCSGNYVDTKVLLTEWATSNIDLYRLFGNQLKISKEFIYKKDKDEISKDMTSMINGHKYGRDQRSSQKFLENFRNWVDKNYPVATPSWSYLDGYDWNSYTKEEREISEYNSTIKAGLYHLINSYTLAENIYSEPTFSIELANGKEYTVQKGSKPLKALAKISSSYGIDGFEDFRICHSQVLNQKELKGRMVLSIHPLDYWTMSDNDCGWDSCMSWREEGSYRQGTIEMMNSSSVVVAYLQSSEPMEIDDKYWSNKKWRQLFIVDKDVILGIKDYPYHNEQLNIDVAKWLKELAKENMGWEYTTEEPEYYTDSDKQYINPEESGRHYLNIEFCSEIMYLDVGCMDWHALYLGKNLFSLKPGENPHIIIFGDTFEYNYSGCSQCMECGETYPDFCAEKGLICENCSCIEYCSECGEQVTNPYYFRGVTLCSACYDNLVGSCSICHNQDYTDNMENIYIIPYLSEQYQKKLLKHESGIPIDTTKYPKDYIYQYFSEAFRIPVCRDCKKLFEEEYIKPQARIHKFEGRWNTYFAVYINDLTPLGLKLLPNRIATDFLDTSDTFIQSNYSAWDLKRVIEIEKKEEI